ncbi:unnamed protein product [Adineta ricciae]|uniref:Uncharacterized protein n=1 Tax=Adineta ricciae TaxID=249248 RepID=A0A816C0X7_ADIRI|nr:unnamed protein product [Adineta ricciae]
MTVTIRWINNQSTRGSNVLVERGNGEEVRVNNGGSAEVNWSVPYWSSGKRMIVNNNGPRIWIVDRDNALLTSIDDGPWRHYTSIRGGDQFGLIIRDDGVLFAKI